MESIHINVRSKKITAFILALLFYLLILALLLLEIAPILHLNSFNPFQEQSASIPLIPQAARKNPAPIRYMSPQKNPAQKIPTASTPHMPQPPLQTTQQPAQPEQTSAPSMPQPSTQQSPQQVDASSTDANTSTSAKATADMSAETAVQKKETVQKTLPEAKERMLHEQKKLQEEFDMLQERKNQLMTMLKKLDQSENATVEQDEEQYYTQQQRKQRSRSKWYKSGAEPEPKAQEKHNYHPSKMAALADDFYKHMRKQYDKNLPTGVNGAENGSVDAKAIEYGMFLYRFNHQLCNESHMRPLPLHARLINPHIIEVVATVSRTRKITNVKFPKPSYDEQLNEYIKDLLYAMVAPQLPASYPENETLLPLKVKIDRVYNQDKLWLYPVD